MHSELDHLVWAVPELTAGVDEMARRTGVTATAGGRHPGIGTHNALLDLGERRYLEILAPDPSQDRFSSFGSLIHGIEQPRLLTWAARTDDIRAVACSARAAGMSPGPTLALSRRRPDGTSLSWRLMQVGGHDRGPLVPFFIEWRSDEHPSLRGAGGCRLVEFTIFTPEPEAIDAALAPLGLGYSGQARAAAGLRAVIDTPNGRVVLD